MVAGVTIRTEDDVLTAAAALAALGPEVVIITSAELQDAPGECSAIYCGPVCCA